MSQPYPLGKLTVVELTRTISGCYAGKMLAEAGAEVVRIEPPDGDPLRRWKSSAALQEAKPLENGETGALFHYLNGNKQSVTLNAESADGRESLYHLLRGAHILIEDGTLADTGIEVNALRGEAPSLSVISISDWGRDGPYAGRAASEFTLQAETGSTAGRGYEDRMPIAAGGELGEYVAGIFAAVAALAAWAMARDDGRGRDVDVSRLETMLIAFQPYQYIHGQLEPGVPMPRSVEIPSVEPASDGWVGFCPTTPKQWRDFAGMIGHPEMGENPELATALQRFTRLDSMQPLIHEWTRRHTVEENVTEAARRRIPVAPVGNGETVLDMDHFIERGVFVRNPAGFVQPRPPYRFGKGPLREPAAAPEPGEHNELLSHNRELPPGAEPRRDSAGSLPMAGLRVVDLAAFWAGPVGSACFAALGADVIKIESIQRPDGMRFAAGFFPEDKPLWECSPITHGANAGKRGITLDMTQPRGRELLERLIAESDIVIENFSPRVMEQFGLGWERIREINSEAIMVRMPAFGLDGPWRDRTGFAMTIEQVSGLAWRTGYPDRSPLVPRGVVDSLGGMNAAFATLAALELRRQGHGGQLVEVALAEAGLAIAGEQVAEFTAYGELLERHANRGAAAVPQGVFRCADGELIAISIANDRQWAALLTALDATDSTLSQWRSIDDRRDHEAAIERELASILAARDGNEWLERLPAHGVPAAPLRNMRELQHHPQLRARGFFNRLRHPVVGELDYPNFPFRIDGHYPAVSRPAPLLGEHNDEVLKGVLGLNDAEIADLAAADIIGSRPVFAR